RINAQLIDAAAGGHIWADRFDRDSADLFAVQDEVIGKIEEALVGKLTAADLKERAPAATGRALKPLQAGRSSAKLSGRCLFRYGGGVLVVDDDAAMREWLAALFRSVGLHTDLCGSATALLERKPPEVESCVVLDVRLPGVSGLEFQTHLAGLYRGIPIVFMT